MMRVTSASLPIKEVLTRTHAREAMRSAAIRHLLTAWLPELAGYGGWDNAAEYIDNMPDYRMYGLATWFYKIRSRPAWAAKLDNPPDLSSTRWTPPAQPTPDCHPPNV